ncbi:uncharacterized protein H6S33_002610 [Morchella sextelata]|uniref:uncharacterized protein n=1 Tax=Morchella sextelata TaxID=1174677 RepID=UPI001D056612|nr:uncharacterized protein H6S33_002610 [Morchella sextelata]KAH0607576.1 hypothetical protein H6S33_002610 [Morchella sextelata]
MPPRLKAAPKPVARRRVVGGEASAEASQPSTGPSTPAAEIAEPLAPIAQAPPSGRLDSLTPKPLVGPPIRGAAGGLKFKPKAIARKTKEERDAIAAKFEASATPTPARGNRGDRGQRGGRGRGRGRGGFSDAPATASGPFALGSVNTGRLKEVAVERGTNFTKHRQSMGADLDGVKRKAKMKTEDGQEINYSSSDDSDDARMDVEFIGYLDDLAGKKDDEGDQQMDDEGRPWGAGAPLRVPRSHHHELKSSVNTDSSTKTDKGIKKGKSKVEFETTIKIKDEPVDDDDIALPDLDSPPLSTPSPKAAKPDPEVLTQQFKEETEMEELDRQATLREMVGDFSGIKVDDDVEMESGITDSKKNLELDNQIFCFQFPEILPQLVSSEDAKESIAVAPVAPINTDDKSAASAPPLPNVPLSLKQQKISARAQMALLESFPPSGIAGQLRVHKSGRISILWGSQDSEDGPIEFDVSRGSRMGFLQEAVVIKQKSPWGEQDVDEKGRQKGAAFSLGQIKGKFVVCPNFGQLIGAEKDKKRKDKKGKGKATDIQNVEP